MERERRAGERRGKGLRGGGEVDGGGEGGGGEVEGGGEGGGGANVEGREKLVAAPMWEGGRGGS